MGQELALVIKKESGFNFLEEFSYLQVNELPVQSESNQNESQEPVQEEKETEKRRSF